MMTYQWIKHGLIFEPQNHSEGRPWLNVFAQGPATLIRDDTVRVYFSCRPPADEKGMFVSYSAYVDFDRQNFPRIKAVSENPVLDLGGLGCFDEFGTYPFSVVEDVNGLRGYFGGWTRCESVPFNVAIGCAESHDGGTSFQRLGPGPVISYSPDEPFVMSGPKIRKFNDQYLLYYIAGKKWLVHDRRAEPVYTIRMARSTDGINWVKEHRELLPPRIEEDESQASPDVIYRNGMYHMFFCYRASINYRGKEGGYRIGYALSADGFNWSRDDTRAGITISENGFDDEMVAYPHVFELDSKIYMLYLGNGVGRGGFALAELRGDL